MTKATDSRKDEILKMLKDTRPKLGTPPKVDNKKPQQPKRDKELEIKREKLINNIVLAHDVEEWAKGPLATELSEHFKVQLDEREKDIHADLDRGDKPIPSADQSKYHGYREAMQRVLGTIDERKNAVKSALSRAREFEASEESEFPLNYVKPKWGLNYHNEARKRMGLKPIEAKKPKGKKADGKANK